MSSSSFVATILGIPSIPSIVEVNVRAAPGTNQPMTFKVPLRIRASVVDVAPDVEGRGLSNKVYHWLKLDFSDGRSGWVRDDLITVEGDGSRFGYGFISRPLLAFALTRQAVTPPAPEAPPTTPAPPPATDPLPGSGSTPVRMAHVIARVQGGVNIRSAPSLRVNPPLGRLQFGEKLRILGVMPDQNFPNNLRWINVEYQNRSGWVREDVVRLEGEYDQFELGTRDAYPTPMENCFWQRDFNIDPKYYDVVHHGWDFSARIGEAVLAGPKGGTVMRTFRCTKCVPQAPSAVDQGLGLNNFAVLNDPAWGYGYGHYVIIRYLSDALPESTKQILGRRSLAGAHIYAMYAHLNSIECVEGQNVAGGARIGTCGNSGNSSGPHLHLEIRASFNPNDTNWSGMFRNLLSPALLFLR